MVHGIVQTLACGRHTVAEAGGTALERHCCSNEWQLWCRTKVVNTWQVAG